MKSFPETNFFWTAVGDRRKSLAKLGLPTGLEPEAIRHVLDLLDVDADKHAVPSFFLSFSSAVRHYLDILNQAAESENKNMWVEKTPLHVFNIDIMEKYVRHPHFVHIIRDGRDVVASICHRAEEYPDRFGHQRDPAYGIDLWNRAVRESLCYLESKRHVFTTYDRITESPDSEIQALCKLLDLEFAPAMATGDPDVQEDIVPEDRPWIHRAKKPPESQRESKFDRLFSDSEKVEIEKELNLRLKGRIEQHIKAIRDNQSTA
jgi:hypothetical protein